MIFKKGQYVKVKYKRSGTENCLFCGLFLPQEMKDETKDKVYRIRKRDGINDVYLEGCSRWCFCDHILTYPNNDEMEAMENEIQKRNAHKN